VGRALIDCVYGPIKSGKSRLVEALIATCDRPCVVIDYLADLSDDPLVVPPVHDVVRLGARGGREGFRAAIELAAAECYQAGSRVLVVDELDLAVYKGESLAFELPGFYEYISTARHRDCGLILATRRPAAIPPDVRDIATDLHVFRQDADNALRYFADLGIDPSLLTALPGHAYVHRRSGSHHVHRTLWAPCTQE
jgi:hypothetical protein